MEGQALKNHCSAAAAGFLPKRGGGGGGRRSFSSSCWTPPRFLRHPKRTGGRISVVERTPPLRSLPPLSLQQQQQEFVEGNDVEEEEEEDASKLILHEMTTMSSGGILKSRRTTTTTTVHVKFVLQRECSFGERFLLVGDDPMFGLWDLQNAIPLNWSEGHFWTAEMDLPLEKSTIQYKFILGDPSGEFHWQPGPDRVLQIWETPNTIVVTEDWDKAENQKVTEEEEEEQSIISNNGGDDAAVQLLVSCGLASIDDPPPPNDDVVENEKPLDILFTSEI